MAWDWVAFWDFAQALIAPAAAIFGGLGATVWAGRREDRRTATARQDAREEADRLRRESAREARLSSFRQLLDASLTWAAELRRLRELSRTARGAAALTAPAERKASATRILSTFRDFELTLAEFEVNHSTADLAPSIRIVRNEAEEIMEDANNSISGAIVHLDNIFAPETKALRGWLDKVRALGRD